MRRRDLQTLVLTALFLSLSCPDVVQAGDWVERSDAPCAGGYGEDAFYMFNWFDKSDLSAHIVINEVEQNPYGIDEGNEWVELYNPTTTDVNLDGWKLSTTHGKTVTVTLRRTIPANGYFVYTHTEQWLDNEDESVTLRDPSLNEIDRTPYLTEPYRIDNGYYSWQRYPNGNDTDSDSDWRFRAVTKGYGSCGEPPKTIYVDDDFIDDPPNHEWNTIQEGINDAFNGTTIIVRDGIYRENVDVHKRLTIHSENGADATIVRAASSSEPVFYVTTDYVNISGFMITGTEYPGTGIYLYSADHCNASCNNVSNNGDGICISSSSNNTLTSNTANLNSGYGIYLSSSSSNTLTSNLMSDNQYNFGVSGWNDSYFDNNIDTTNLVDGKPVHYIRGADGVTFDYKNHADAGTVYGIQCNNITIKDITLTNNGAGVFFWKTNNSRIENVNVLNNDYGICLHYSSNNTLKDNNASNNHYGIYSYHLSNSTLVSNTCFSNWFGILLWHLSNSTPLANMCSNNSGGGICLADSSNNILTDNTCSNNDDGGIALMLDSSNNRLYHNNFIDNNGNAYDLSDCTNFWNSSTEGNYYSDYAGCDNDTDGIGDTPHPIPSYNVDYFPLMQPWSEDTQQKGDLDGDGGLTTADAVIALQMAVRGEYDDNADMNGDGWVSSVDALMIMQAAAGCIKIG